jgi:ABC-2 type transport system permease protein
VTSLERERPPVVWAESPSLIGTLTNFIQKTLIIAEIDLRKLRHDPTELITRAIQPALWLLIFGQVFSQIRAIPTGDLRYLDFMAPGILAQSVLFISIFYGLHTIWERDAGTLHKFLVSPTPRSALVFGKAVSAGVRGLAQTVIIYLLAALLGVSINWNPLAILGVMLAVMLGAGCFACISMIIACIVKNRERFMGIGQLLTMPLFFASNAIYPISIMPGWLQFISRINPLTYEVDALRALMLTGQTSGMGLVTDYMVLFITLVVLVAVATKLYPRVIV